MIKKNYYTESLKQLEEMDNELRKIQESMTEEEKLTDLKGRNQKPGA